MKTILLTFALVIATTSHAKPTTDQMERTESRIYAFREWSKEDQLTPRKLALEGIRQKSLMAYFQELNLKFTRGSGPALALDKCGSVAETMKNGDVAIRAYCDYKTPLRITPKINVFTCDFDNMDLTAARTHVMKALDVLVLERNRGAQDGTEEAMKIRAYHDMVDVYGKDQVFKEEIFKERESDLLPRPVQFRLGEWEGC